MRFVALHCPESSQSAGTDGRAIERQQVLRSIGSAYGITTSRTYLSSVERSEHNASIDNISQIAKGLRVEPWRLLKDE
jgi:hypothetical protein